MQENNAVHFFKILKFFFFSFEIEEMKKKKS